MKHSIRLLLHYLKFEDVPVPVQFIPIFSNAHKSSYLGKASDVALRFIPCGKQATG